MIGCKKRREMINNKKNIDEKKEKNLFK